MKSTPLEFHFYVHITKRDYSASGLKSDIMNAEFRDMIRCWTQFRELGALEKM